ncbi:unnamed protein product [Boreogadus saida]
MEQTTNPDKSDNFPRELNDKAKLCRFLCYGSVGDTYAAFPLQGAERIGSQRHLVPFWVPQRSSHQNGAGSVETRHYTPREEFQPRMERAGALLSLLQEGRGGEVVEEVKRFVGGGHKPLVLTQSVHSAVDSNQRLNLD